MPTTPLGVWTPDDGDDWDLTIDLAALAISADGAIDTAVNAAKQAIEQGATRVIGTNAQRLALVPPTRKPGLEFYTTDTRLEWIHNGTLWLEREKHFPGIFGAIPTGQNVLVRYGYSTLTRAANGTATFTYPEEFPTQVLGINATTVRDAAMNPVVNSGAISRTAATLVWPGSGAGAVSFSWMIWGY